MNCETQKQLKKDWREAARKHFYIKCRSCGRFVEITKEQQGKKLLSVNLYCEHCDKSTDLTGNNFSFKYINRSADFEAVWTKDHDSIKLWKQSVCPVHSSEIKL